MIGWLVVVVVLWAALPVDARTFYVTSSLDAPAPTGTACTTGSRCTLKYAVDNAVGNDLISLKAGTTTVPLIYRGANDMIAPLSDRGGAPGQPIVVTCETPGGCLLDGQFSLIPINIKVGNNHWTISDLNAKNGTENVVVLNGNSGTARRIVAWDVKFTAKGTILGCQQFGSNNLFEDSAAFGIATNMIASGQNENGSCTFRRVWGRFEGTSNGANWAGPMGYLYYNTINATCENCLGDYWARGGPTRYLVSALTQTFTSNNSCPSQICIDGQAPLPGSHQILRYNNGDRNANGQVLGVIHYAKATANLSRIHLAAFPSISDSTLGINTSDGEAGGGVLFKDIVTVVDPTHALFANIRGMNLPRRNTAFPLTATKTSSIAAVANSVNTGTASWAGWTVTNAVVQPSLNALTTANANPWTGTTGGQVCYKYIDRVLTTQKLWPWAMNQRILDATGSQADRYTGPVECPTGGCQGPYPSTSVCLAAGTHTNGSACFPLRTAVNVMTDIQALLGDIPAACSETGVTTFLDAAGFSPPTLTSF